MPLLPAFASVPCLWVVREGLSVVLHHQCFKSLLQATASAFKYSYLTHPSWEQDGEHGWSSLAASPLSKHLAQQLCFALDRMKTPLVCLLAMWLLAAFAWTSDSRGIARYISDHSESRRNVVGTVFLRTCSFSAPAKHLYLNLKTDLLAPEVADIMQAIHWQDKLVKIVEDELKRESFGADWLDLRNSECGFYNARLLYDHSVSFKHIHSTGNNI